MIQTARRPVRLTLAGIAASVALALIPAGAGAATRRVEMEGVNFSPANVTIARGDKVRWVNESFLDHDVYATAPRGYFSSGREGGMSQDERYSFTFRSAGRFSYVCRVHPGMDGTVTVPIHVTKLSGPVRFRVTLGTATLSGSWRHVVQVKKPGSSTWSTFRTTTSTSATYDPPKRGTYRFRAKLLNTSTDRDSGWSPSVSKSY
jgi:plastocyanin